MLSALVLDVKNMILNTDILQRNPHDSVIEIESLSIKALPEKMKKYKQITLELLWKQ